MKYRPYHQAYCERTLANILGYELISLEAKQKLELVFLMWNSGGLRYAYSFNLNALVHRDLMFVYKSYILKTIHADDFDNLWSLLVPIHT